MTQRELFGQCPFTTVQKVLSGKWAIVVLHHLQGRTLRFSELQKELPDLTQATLTKQLRSLEDYGLVQRAVYAQIPPKVEYSLTEIGRQFGMVMDSIQKWGELYIDFLREKQATDNAPGLPAY